MQKYFFTFFVLKNDGVFIDRKFEQKTIQFVAHLLILHRRTKEIQSKLLVIFCVMYICNK